MKKIIALLLSVTSCQVFSNIDFEIDQIINSNQEPFGVVFEVVEGDKDAWKWVAPMLEKQTLRLRNKYPEIAIAIVSHGYEQFQLTKSNAKNNQKMTNILKDLVINQNADLHVCGTHSSWYQVSDDEYIDLVDVSISGPAKINDYKNLDYDLVVIDNN